MTRNGTKGPNQRSSQNKNKNNFFFFAFSGIFGIFIYVLDFDPSKKYVIHLSSPQNYFGKGRKKEILKRKKKQIRKPHSIWTQLINIGSDAVGSPSFSVYDPTR